MVSVLFYLEFWLLFEISSVFTSKSDANQHTNIRCEELCSEATLKLSTNLKLDCQRGCRYFNIEFLSSAGNLNKVTDLNTTQDLCKSSCTEAYIDKVKREACQTGCSKMFELQSKSPYIHGWLVYMGASSERDHSGGMMFLQPDLDIPPSDDDWLLFDSAFRPRDYDGLHPYKLTETRIQTMPIYPVRKHISTQFCIPTWMWMIPIMLVFAIVWIQYGNTIRNVFIYEDVEEEDDDTEEDSPGATKKLEEDFIVALDSYFYPSPAIPPPPKYSAKEESILMSSDDEENLLRENEDNSSRQSKTKA
uniref:Putative secreted protein n=1 Tax=Phlebotomus kandelakii TaxID=1109342 RepID=A0A6B2EEH7_9DIPT